MKSTFFSIIMLVYNTKESYLRLALKSVLDQNYDNYEIIIIDDGSNKQTKDILEEYKNKCIIKHQENMGMPASRIEGLKIAKGDYVIFVDSDDYINVDTLNIYNNIICEYKSDVVMHDFVKFKNDISNVIGHAHYFKQGVVEKDEVIKELCLIHTNGTCGRAVKRELFKDMDKHINTSLAVGEDVQQSAYVLLNANSYYYTDKDIYYYRIVDEHREYNSIKNLNDANFLTPVYKLIFKDDKYLKYLDLFKMSAANSLVYNGFRMCLWIKDKKERYSLLDKLNELEISNIVNSIDKKIPFVSSFLYSLLNKKHYFLLKVFAHIYDLVYGMQKL